MNTQKSVYNRLFSKVEKTELESQKVELSIAGDVQKALKSLTAQEKAMLKNQKAIEKAYTQINKAKREATEVYNEFKVGVAPGLSINPYTVLKEARAMAKDLGVVPSNIKGFDELEDEAKYNEDLKKKIEATRNELQKLVK